MTVSHHYNQQRMTGANQSKLNPFTANILCHVKSTVLKKNPLLILKRQIGEKKKMHLLLIDETMSLQPWHGGANASMAYNDKGNMLRFSWGIVCHCCHLCLACSHANIC